MSRLSELVAELCPDGVEYKALGEISAVTDGSHTSPKGVENGFPMPSVKDMRPTGFDLSDCKRIGRQDYEALCRNGCRPEIGDVLIAKDGSVLKHAFAVHEDCDLVVLSSIAIIRPDAALIDSDFMAHYMSSDGFKQAVLQRYISVSGVPRIILKNFKLMRIPVPPIEIQREIVRILDSFQELDDALTAEIKARRKQYAYYRDELFKFEREEYKTLGELCTNLDSKRKPVTKSSREPGPYPYYGASGIVDYVSGYLFDGEFLLVAEDGANLVARSTPIAFVATGKTWVNNHAHILEFSDKTMQAYVEMYLNSIDLTEFITGAAQPKLSQKNLNRIPIPVPVGKDMTVMVERLKLIQELANDLSSGLPAEIEARHKQYEYYRDCLLTFPEKEV